MGHKRYKPLFPWPGGKSKLLSSILPFLPATSKYVEPFAGGLAVLLAKPPSPKEVAGDLNRDLVDFYRIASRHPDALISELAGYFQSRDFFDHVKNSSELTELGRAARFYYLQRASFGGKGQHYGRGKEGYHGVDIFRDAVEIRRASARLRNVEFRCQPANDLIREMDSPDTVFFCDPPYIACADTAYDAFSIWDMVELRETLRACKGMWLLTCDDSPSTRHVFAGFAARENKIQYSIAKDKTGKISGELMVFSDSLAADHSGETITLAPKTKADNTVDFHAGETLAM